jgi:hypothetical protein
MGFTEARLWKPSFLIVGMRDPHAREDTANDLGQQLETQLAGR